MTGPDGGIWILGGSGDVGRRLAAILARTGAEGIVLCGRDGARAERIARQSGAGIEGRHLDVSTAGAASQIPEGAAVINLTEATHPAFAGAAVASGGVFIESSASPDYVDSVKRAAQVAGQGLAVVNAGVMPGLSNILAHEIAATCPDVTAVDTVIEMGMGRHYGGSATRWTIASLGRRYDVMIDGATERVEPGQLRRSVPFSGDRKPRPAIGFPFSDQQSLTGSGLVTARSFLALDPVWMTRLIALCLRLGLGRPLSRANRGVQSLLGRTPAMGHTRTRLFIEGRDRDQRPVAWIEVKAGDQADFTAVMLAETLIAARASQRVGLAESQDILAPAQALKAIKAAFEDATILTSGGQADTLLYGKDTQ